MIQISDKAECCGCTACFSICPKQAVKMSPDEEGFLYPCVNQIKCTDCGLCNKVCPMQNRESRMESTKGYIIRYADEAVVMDSTSGGVFSAFALYFLSIGGVVYGTGYDSNMKVCCKKAEFPDDIQELRGSKFVQSYLGTIFFEIKEMLMRGKQVLFVGTPCQVSGLVGFLGKKMENLFLMDFVCRGVSSPGLWKNYVEMMEKKYGAKMLGAKFKNKTYGYHASTMKIDFENGKTWYGSGRVDPMMKAFVSELASRPSCASCSFKGIERSSDITMFDCYEYSQITGEKDDDKGYSSLFVHTEKGGEALNAVADNLIMRETSIDDLITRNGIMVCHSAAANCKRDYFFKAAGKYPIDKAMQLVSPITRMDYAVELGKRVLFKMGWISFGKKLKRKESVKVSS